MQTKMADAQSKPWAMEGIQESVRLGRRGMVGSLTFSKQNGSFSRNQRRLQLVRKAESSCKERKS